MKCIFDEKINDNRSFREFSMTEAVNLQKISPTFSRCNPFPSWPSAAQKLMFTPRALVE